jgi:Protein of unknown function (DUF2591)
MNIKTSELTGIALDWAVTRAGRPDRGNMTIWRCGYIDYNMHHYCSDPARGIDIMEREKIGVMPVTVSRDANETGWRAEHFTIAATAYGPTIMVAAMRCYVVSKLGDEVDIPEGLL